MMWLRKEESTWPPLPFHPQSEVSRKGGKANTVSRPRSWGKFREFVNNNSGETDSGARWWGWGGSNYKCGGKNSTWLRGTEDWLVIGCRNWWGGEPCVFWRAVDGMALIWPWSCCSPLLLWNSMAWYVWIITVSESKFKRSTEYLPIAGLSMFKGENWVS